MFSSSVELVFNSDNKENSTTNVAQMRKRLRDLSNPFTLPEAKFISNFRINKDVLQNILEELDGKFVAGIKTSSIPPILKLCAALRFFATGSYQQNIGDDFCIGMAQPTVSIAIKEVVDLFERFLCHKWIRFDRSDAEILECKLHFMAKHNLPGVVGCVDGTHIKIIAPNKCERHLFYNRKGYFSLNVMIVCDHNLVIRFVDSRHPGANHDSFVWNNSLICATMARNYENGERNRWLLGDSGYPLLPFLISPYKQATPESRQGHFNKVHISARNVIERTNGVLKSRFRCLLAARELHYSPNKAKQIINTCCVLHNMCIFYNVEYSELEEDSDAPEEDSDTPQEDNTGLESEPSFGMNTLLQEGKRVRDEILFSL